MEDLFHSYSVTEIIICCVLIAIAVKEVIEFFDWAWGRIQKVTDKDYKTEEERKNLEQKTDDAEKFMTTERERLDGKIAELQEADKNVMEEVQRINAQILDKLTAIDSTLNEHIRVDDERNADSTREYILHFNMECIRGMQHTKEDFNEVLAKIREYKNFCETHPDYQNDRAVLAIENVERIYKERMQKRDFL